MISFLKKHTEAIAWLLISIGIVIVAMFCGLVYANNLGWGQDVFNIERTGQAGSFVGGTAGALWALAGVFFFKATLDLQRQANIDSNRAHEDRLKIEAMLLILKQIPTIRDNESSHNVTKFLSSIARKRTNTSERKSVFALIQSEPQFHDIYEAYNLFITFIKLSKDLSDPPLKPLLYSTLGPKLRQTIAHAFLYYGSVEDQILLASMDEHYFKKNDFLSVDDYQEYEKLMNNATSSLVP
jgi:uncharacterized membrane protein